MANKRFPRAKWVLPAVVDPPDRLCFQIEVPNERAHIAAFMGALYNLTSAIFWADDTAHTAKEVALVWRDIFDKLQQGCDCPPQKISVEEMGLDMSICEQLRINSDGVLEGLCCGEWTPIPGAEQFEMAHTGQQGNDAPQPEPGGGEQCYHIQQSANQQYLIPTLVSSGDVLTFSNLGNAGWDGNIIGRWDCPDGRMYLGGNCVDGTQVAAGGGYPLPGAPIMSLIVSIAGVWYSALSPVTVPGGVANAPATVQLNDDSPGDNSGDYSADVCVQNNQATMWSHVGNFLLSPEGFSQATDPSNTPPGDGVWTPSVGWDDTLLVTVTNVNIHGTDIHLLFGAPVTINDLAMVYNIAKGTISTAVNNAVILYLAGVSVVNAFAASSTDPDGTGKVMAIAHGSYVCDEIHLQLRDQATVGAGTAGTGQITGFTASGPGTDPF